MKRFLAVSLILWIAAAAGVAQQRQAVPAIPNAALRDVVLGFYVSQFQQQTEVSDEVFAKILPVLRQFIQERFDISTRRTRAMNQVRRLVNQGGSEEDIKQGVHEVDKADADTQANQEHFLTTIDPLLTPRQQAKVRLFEATSDQRIRQILDRIQNATNGARQNAAPQPKQN